MKELPEADMPVMLVYETTKFFAVPNLYFWKEGCN